MPIDPVVEGEPIETSWGNDVADAINDLETAPPAHGTTHNPGAADAVTTATAGASAVADTANAGAAGSLARSDHRHSREAFGTPGASAVADTVNAGAATTVARSDHRHSREAFGTPGASAFDDTANAGAATTVARSDHRHSRETNPVTAHEADTTDAHDASAVSVLDTAGVYTGVNAETVLAELQTEGTFTPALAYATPGSSSWSVTTAVGFYTRIGRRIFYDLFYQGVPTNGSASGNLLLTGLPFTSSAVSSLISIAQATFRGYTKANFTTVQLTINNNNTTATFNAGGSAQVNTPLAVADIPTGGTVIVRASGSYRID